MRYFASLIVLLMFAVTAATEDSALSTVAEQLSKIAEDTKIEISVERNGRAVTLSYKIRKFMAHSIDKLGRHSEKAHESVGPRYDGLIVTITLQDGQYLGAAKIPQSLRRPYWTTFINAYPISKGKQHLHVNISYGRKTDRETINKIKKLLGSMTDDDPKVKPKESGEHNKNVQRTGRNACASSK